MIDKLKRIFRLVFYLLLCVILCSVVCWGVIILHDPNVFPVRNVVVQCDPMIVDQATLRKLILPLVKGGFFVTSVVEIRDILQEFPEISAVKVRRIWPDGIMIRLVLEDAVAQWNEHGFLNQYGEVFSCRASVFSVSNLPRFLGYEDVSLKMLDYYRQMNSLLETLGVKINVVALNSGRSWHIQLNNDMILKLGQENILDRLQRFVRVYPKVFRSSRRVKEVDLRYAHGMAVKWSD
jgi:cell division protein FtsQ